MNIAFKISGKKFKAEYTYLIFKEDEKAGEIIYNEDENSCYVIDYDFQEYLEFENTSVSDCLEELSEAYASYYHKQGKEVTFDTELV